MPRVFSSEIILLLQNYYFSEDNLTNGLESTCSKVFRKTVEILLWLDSFPKVPSLIFLIYWQQFFGSYDPMTIRRWELLLKVNTYGSTKLNNIDISINLRNRLGLTLKTTILVFFFNNILKRKWDAFWKRDSGMQVI